MSEILVTGAAGQLGRELARADWPAGIAVAALDSRQLDITDASAVARTVAQIRPRVIVNAAAYTAVDQAEDDEERAMAVNGTAVGYLAEAADRAGALLVHVSTDYVFDGTKAGWYVESDPLAPLGVYGRSKAVGEAQALRAEQSVVLRTAWVYSAVGRNFVATMLRLAADRDELGVVDDQVGCPTSAADLAAAIVDLVDASSLGRVALPSSLYHAASPEQASWHQLAMATFEVSNQGFGGVCRRLQTQEYPTRALRPANSRLSSARLADDLGITLPPWSRSLPAVVAELEAVGV